jgi:hypothetical protein
MSTTKQETRRAAKPQQDSPWPHVRLSETDRLETFSDSVLSITITLLVAEIVRPEYASGQLLEKLTAQWASYIAFPCVILLRRSYLAQSSRGVRKGALLPPQSSPG